MLVLGAGSIGARHARNLAAAGAFVDVADPDPKRPACTVSFDLGRLDRYDGIVVASPTLFHVEQARAALATDAHVLVEKPLGMDSQGLDDLVAAGQDRLMVGFNLRLHEPVRRLVDLVHAGKVGRVSAVRLWFGSWLPDWRPNVDYRQTYSARRSLGGGVLLDAIHELDILIWLLGQEPIEVVGAVVGRLGPLEIDVEDTVMALLRLGDVVAEVSLDYLSRRYRRGVEVIGDAATVRLDWARRVIELEDAAGVRSESADTPLDRSYELQAERFLAFIRGEAAPPVDGSVGRASVVLADRIRAAG